MDTDLERIKQAILATYTREEIRLHHVNPLPLPSKEILEGLLEDLLALLYPGYFGGTVTDIPDVTNQVHTRVDIIFEKLQQQIYLSFRHFCERSGPACPHCDEAARGATQTFLEKIPRLREFLHDDVEAAYDGDPAAKSIDEIIFSYPGVYAITIYRIAHELELLHVPLLPGSSLKWRIHGRELTSIREPKSETIFSSTTGPGWLSGKPQRSAIEYASTRGLPWAP